MRYPILGGALQRRGGTARHDAVAWGYARAADARGVDILENCEVTGIRRGASGAVEGVETSRGFIAAGKIGIVAAGNTSVVANMAGIRVPLMGSPFPAPVSEAAAPAPPSVAMCTTPSTSRSHLRASAMTYSAATHSYTSSVPP